MKNKHERTPKTHFDVIPLEIVKKIAKEDSSEDVSKDKKAEAGNITERVDGKRKPRRAPAPLRDIKRP